MLFPSLTSILMFLFTFNLGEMSYANNHINRLRDRLHHIGSKERLHKHYKKTEYKRNDILDDDIMQFNNTYEKYAELARNLMGNNELALLDDNGHQEFYNTDNLTPYNTEALKNVISKQNALIKRLSSLYQTEVKQRQFEKILNSVNTRNKNLLRQRNLVKTNANGANADNIVNMIRIDEFLVKKRLAADPFIRRILEMAKKKKDEYIRKRKIQIREQRKG